MNIFNHIEKLIILHVHHANAAIEQKYKIMKRTVQEVDCLWPCNVKFFNFNLSLIPSMKFLSIPEWSSKSFAAFLSVREVEKVHDMQQYLQLLNHWRKHSLQANNILREKQSGVRDIGILMSQWWKLGSIK